MVEFDHVEQASLDLIQLLINNMLNHLFDHNNKHLYDHNVNMVRQRIFEDMNQPNLKTNKFLFVKKSKRKDNYQDLDDIHDHFLAS